jgi:transcription elongation factor Elf1
MRNCDDLTDNPSPTEDLSAAVDVYSDWVDACDAVAKNTATKNGESELRGMNSSDQRLVSLDGEDVVGVYNDSND